MDRGVTRRLYGNYRAKVVENKDTEKFGKVLVYIPDLMPLLENTSGIWARPANNPIGGRNIEDGNESDNFYMGTSYIPAKGSWVWVFFEAGNINRPYYFGALDLENTKVLPENQLGSNYEKKWTILRSHEGRVVIVSDDPDDARTEITGKKRKIEEPVNKPSGNTESVYQIDENQTTILFDERTGKEKVLIRTYKGDFLHIDIDERKLQAFFEDDIIIKTNKSFYLTAKEDIHILSEEGEIRATSENDFDIKTKGGDLFLTSEAGSTEIFSAAENNLTAGNDSNVLVAGDYNYQAGGDINGLAGGDMNLDAGGNLNEQTGAASPAGEASTAEDAEEADPKGERDT